MMAQNPKSGGAPPPQNPEDRPGGTNISAPPPPGQPKPPVVAIQTFQGTNGLPDTTVRTVTNADPSKSSAQVSTTGVSGLPPPPGSVNPSAVAPPSASASQSANETSALNNYNADLAAGKAYTNASGAFSNGAMGRVDATTDHDTADALAKAKSLEGGFSAQQMQAQKELNDQSIGQQENANLMRLQSIQGAQGLRGGSATAQQMGLLYNALGQQQQATRQASLDQLAAQQTGVQNFLSDDRTNRAFNTQNAEYNHSQANAEAAGRLSEPLTYAALLQGIRTGADANTLAQEGVDTANQNAATARAVGAGTVAAGLEGATAADIAARDKGPT